MTEAHVVSVSRVGTSCAAKLRIGPPPVFSEVVVENLSPEVYEDLRAAVVGGRRVMLECQPGPPATITGVAILA